MEYEALIIKKYSLEKDLEDFRRKHEAVDNQYRFEQNPATKINLDLQREYFLQEINRVDIQLKNIMKELDNLKVFNSSKLEIKEPQVELKDGARLILDIRPKQELSGNLQKYIFSAWVYSQGSINSSFTINPFTIDQEISEIELPNLLGKWMEECHQDVDSVEIEIFVSSELAYISYENWTFMSLEELEQLRDFYLVYIRNRERHRLVQFNRKFYKSWLDKWNELTQNNFKLVAQNINPDWEQILRNDYWFNGCRLALQKYQNKLIKQGIPLVLWSRCAVAQETHWQEINSLVAEKTLNQALEQVINKRKQAPTEIAEDSTELGHHLVLMLENPHHPPPWVVAELLRS